MNEYRLEIIFVDDTECYINISVGMIAKIGFNIIHKNFIFYGIGLNYLFNTSSGFEKFKQYKIKTYYENQILPFSIDVDVKNFLSKCSKLLSEELKFIKMMYLSAKNKYIDYLGKELINDRISFDDIPVDYKTNEILIIIIKKILNMPFD